MLLRFEHPRLEAELATCPEGLRLVPYEFAEWCERKNIEGPILTCILRTPEENKAVGGHPRSFHLTARAIDFRTRHYSTWELELVEAWFRNRCKPPRFDVVTQPHGTGPHIHVEQNFG